MASGEFAIPVYDILDELGGDQDINALNTVIDSLIHNMTGREVEQWAERFRRVHELHVLSCHECGRAMSEEECGDESTEERVCDECAGL